MRLPRVRFTLKQLMVAVAILATVFGGVAWATKTSAAVEFVWLGEQALEVGVFWPWFTWAARAGLVVALITAITDRRAWRFRSAWALLPFIIPLVILAYGVAFPHVGSLTPDLRRDFEQQRLFELNIMFWLHVPLGIVLLVLLRRVWLVVMGLSIAAAWLSMGSLVMSTMSITGIWL